MPVIEPFDDTPIGWTLAQSLTILPGIVQTASRAIMSKAINVDISLLVFRRLSFRSALVMSFAKSRKFGWAEVAF